MDCSQHAALASKYNKPVVLEEYGAPSTQANQTAIEQQWQATVLSSNIAYDSFWQFGSHSLPNGENENDTYSLVLWDESVSDAGGGACGGDRSEAGAL